MCSASQLNVVTKVKRWPSHRSRLHATKTVLAFEPDAVLRHLDQDAKHLGQKPLRRRSSPTPLIGASQASQHSVVETRPRNSVSVVFTTPLSRQCLDRRIADLDILNTELAAWQTARNTDQRQVDWQFTTDDARIKLRHLYPN